MTVLTRPMLAATAESIEDIRYPVAVTPKLDGIRALTTPSGLLTRSFKSVPNACIRELCASLPHGLDGELMALTAEGYAGFNVTQSAVMSRDGEPLFVYVVFDRFGEEPYWERAHSLSALQLPAWCIPLLPLAVNSREELEAVEAVWLEEGYEGVVCRDATAPYMCRRSTLREHYMVKYKRFVDSEAVVVRILEGESNLNEQTPDAFGYMKRPGGASGRVPRGTMGSLLCRDVHTGEGVRIAGFTDAMRAAVWADQPAYLGRTLRYRYQRAEGYSPRFPRFVAWVEVEGL